MRNSLYLGEKKCSFNQVSQQTFQRSNTYVPCSGPAPLEPLACAAMQTRCRKHLFLSRRSKPARVIFPSPSFGCDWKVFRSPRRSSIRYVFSLLLCFGCRHTGRRLFLWTRISGIFLKIKKGRVEGRHIMRGLRKPGFINESQTGTENIALPFPLLGKYSSSQKRELKHEDKWTPSCQEKPQHYVPACWGQPCHCTSSSCQNQRWAVEPSCG